MPKPNSNRVVSRNKSFQSGPQTYWQTDGQPLWVKLDENILSAAGKTIVSTDPGLSAPTMRALRKAEDTAKQERNAPEATYDLLLGNVDDPEQLDLGIALLSSCIRDNPNATRAELVTRVAAICGFPFYDTAELLIAQEESDEGLLFFDLETHHPRRWTPRAPSKSMAQDSFNRKTDMADEWALLGAEYY